MIPSVRYYIVKSGSLTDIEQLLDGPDSSDALDEFDRMAGDRPANAGMASVLTRYLTEDAPGPLDAETVRKLAGENPGVDLLQSTDPDGHAEYLLPRGGELARIEQIATPNEQGEAELGEQLAEFFSAPNLSEVPATVAYLTIDADMIEPDEELPMSLRRLASAEMEESGLTEITVLVWTE